MAYTALKLITRALFLSQLVSRQLQTPSGDQISDGLYLLNALLKVKGTDLRLIPYFRRYEFDTVYGQEEYFVENLLYVDSLTFNIGTVRYSMRDLTRKEYFATPRVDDVNSLPFSYRPERELGGMRLYFYFEPGGIYQMKLSGKFGLEEVDLNTDLELTFDLYYIEYLRHALAEYFCNEYGATFPDGAFRKFKEIEKKLLEVSPADLSIQKRSYFSGQPGLDWPLCNIPGWVPF